MRAISVRLPDALHAEIEALAGYEVRSVAGQVLALLQEALASRRTPLHAGQSIRSGGLPNGTQPPQSPTPCPPDRQAAEH